MSKYLREFIRLVNDESNVLAESLNLVSHAEVSNAIDNAIRPERLDIKIQGFSDLMREIAIVESGYKTNGAIQHNNELSGGIKGVFQLSPIALTQLKEKSAIPKTKDRFNKSGASQNPWESQTYDDIFSSLKMQAIAASMYVLWLYLNISGSPSLSTLNSRAAFWKKYYNTASDKDATTKYYIDKVNEFTK